MEVNTALAALIRALESKVLFDKTLIVTGRSRW